MSLKITVSKTSFQEINQTQKGWKKAPFRNHLAPLGGSRYVSMSFVAQIWVTTPTLSARVRKLESDGPKPELNTCLWMFWNFICLSQNSHGCSCALCLCFAIFGQVKPLTSLTSSKAAASHLVKRHRRKRQVPLPIPSLQVKTFAVVQWSDASSVHSSLKGALISCRWICPVVVMIITRSWWGHTMTQFFLINNMEKDPEIFDVEGITFWSFTINICSVFPIVGLEKNKQNIQKGQSTYAGVQKSTARPLATSEPRKNNPPAWNFRLYWLLNGDPCNGLLQSLYKWVV